jgi:hypothetical protein
VAPDGSVALLDGPELEGPFGTTAEGETAVALFSASGEPLRTFAVPEECDPSNFAYTTGWMLIDDYRRAFLMDARDGSLRELDLDPWISEERHGTYGFSPDGREVWVVTRPEGRFLRFARPE